jgi:hypothetical protein
MKKTIAGHRYIAAVCDSSQSDMRGVLEIFDKSDQIEESVESRSGMV